MRNCYNFNMKPFDLRLRYEGLKRYLLTNENTNSKLQAPNHKQSPSSKFQVPNIGLCGSDERGRILGNRGLCGSDERGRILGNRLSLEFWICLRFVIWSWELSYWRLIKSFIPKSAIEWRGDPDGCEKI
jgi:hypothetical protein